ncbi:MAG: hypothetical protein HYX92_19590 [Chloroflexi bacterium]|nr:hypothetical protein [Chloroflexota bacterium]
MAGERVQIHLYSVPAAPALDIMELSRYVAHTLSGCDVEVRESFIAFHLCRLPDEARGLALTRLTERFARARVRNPDLPKAEFTPLPGEIDYERRRLTGAVSRVFGILYDGEELREVLQGLLPREEAGLRHIHIAFTNQLFGTWDGDDRRYHARVNVCGYLSLISTTGVVEAPAKPREYYFLRQQFSSLGLYDAAAVALQTELKGRFIEYDDKRLTEVMKGYVMQAIFYHFTGEAFCPDRDCRLFNAHWQEEVLHAQLDGKYEFCPRHTESINMINMDGQDGQDLVDRKRDRKS